MVCAINFYRLLPLTTATYIMGINIGKDAYRAKVLPWGILQFDKPWHPSVKLNKYWVCVYVCVCALMKNGTGKRTEKKKLWVLPLGKY